MLAHAHSAASLHRPRSGLWLAILLSSGRILESPAHNVWMTLLGRIAARAHSSAIIPGMLANALQWNMTWDTWAAFSIFASAASRPAFCIFLLLVVPLRSVTLVILSG